MLVLFSQMQTNSRATEEQPSIRSVSIPCFYFLFFSSPFCVFLSYSTVLSDFIGLTEMLSIRQNLLFMHTSEKHIIIS